jgi:hypothetical protein
MWKRTLRLSAILVLAGIPSVPEIFELRPLTGSVTDKRGNTLPASAVQLENMANLSVVSYITGKDGLYHFNQLHYDVDYTVKAKYRNYWSASKTLSKFDSSKHPRIDLVIPIE